MAISNPEIKKLYGLSAGRCGICKIDVFENEVHIGEMAHIIARSERGARGYENLNCGRNSYENLILLCANHHSEVDQNPQYYTVEKLLQIKSEHEKNIATLFEAPQSRTNDVNFINTFMKFVPFTQLRYFVDHLPLSIKLDISLVGDMFEAICKDNPHLYPLNDSILQSYFENFIRKYFELWNVIAGYSDIDGRSQANFSQADNRSNLRMEKQYLTYDVITDLNQKLDVLNSNFIDAYMQLMDFLRNNYKDVNLNSYSAI